MVQSDSPDYERRFSGVRRLYGEQGLAKLQAAHACIIGIGGVGSWAVEALARSAVGHITLIDLDNIAESNVNRQLHAIDGIFGMAKVTAMAQRIKAINPACVVQEIEEFVTPENVAEMLNSGFDMVLDAIDDARAKVAIAAYCKKNNIQLVIVGGAGGRLDPTKIKQGDLSQVVGDRLLAKVRNQLRRDHGFPKSPTSAKKSAAKFGITAVYSDEQVLQPNAEIEQSCEVETAITGLNCAGYGSSVCVTAPFGMAAAAIVLNQLLK
ncbi:MAG: tRNA threonylcarbamoyladenosine dehydratase [Burkholderiaceae bacterium]|nr:tRNA threonylcarbamoyladenosine dehydratase [Burkholderiaceae bacterium]